MSILKLLEDLAVTGNHAGGAIPDDAFAGLAKSQHLCCSVFVPDIEASENAASKAA